MTPSSSLSEREREAVVALALMVSQYLHVDGEILDSLSMSAGEWALGVLSEYGVVDFNGRWATWTEAGRRVLKEKRFP